MLFGEFQVLFEHLPFIQEEEYPEEPDECAICWAFGCTTVESDCATVLNSFEAAFDCPVAEPDADEEILGLPVQTPFLHVSLVHLPLVQEYDVEKCDECVKFLALGCMPDEPDFATVLKISDVDFDWP